MTPYLILTFASYGTSKELSIRGLSEVVFLIPRKTGEGVNKCYTFSDLAFN